MKNNKIIKEQKLSELDLDKIERKYKPTEEINKCYLDSISMVNHEHVNELYKNKLVIVGRLFEGRAICGYCYLVLSQLVVQPVFPNQELILQQKSVCSQRKWDG